MCIQHTDLSHHCKAFEGNIRTYWILKMQEHRLNLIKPDFIYSWEPWTTRVMLCVERNAIYKITKEWKYLIIMNFCCTISKVQYGLFALRDFKFQGKQDISNKLHVAIKKKQLGRFGQNCKMANWWSAWKKNFFQSSTFKWEEFPLHRVTLCTRNIDFVIDWQMDMW